MVLTYGNNNLKFNTRWLNHISLPPYTLRLRYKDNVTPTFRSGTAVQVSQRPNIWDLTYEDANWYYLLYEHRDLLEVVAAGDTSGVERIMYTFQNCTSLEHVCWFDTSNMINMSYAFSYCISLQELPFFNTSNVVNMAYTFYETPISEIPLFDTHNVGNFRSTFEGCTNLVNIPLLDTSSVVYMSDTFNGCVNVESGALALYQQVSSQATPPTSHSRTFTNCGSNTVTGAAELAQIPSDWK